MATYARNPVLGRQRQEAPGSASLMSELQFQQETLSQKLRWLRWRASEIVLPIKVLTCRTAGPTSILRSHKAEGEN